MFIFLKRLSAFRAAANLSQQPWLRHIRWLNEWSRSLRKSSSSMTDERPWMTFGSIEFLEKYLRSDMRVYEWGSGGSTLFFAKRAKEVITIENDAEWAMKVRNACNKLQYSHVSIEHISQDDTLTATDFDPSDPSVFLSNAALHHGASFRHYATHIARFPDAHFDLVVVDGRSRPSCIQQAIPKVKTGGILVLDNAERFWYQRGRALLDSWQQNEFTGPAPYCAPFSQTVAWRKKR